MYRVEKNTICPETTHRGLMRVVVDKKVIDILLEYILKKW